jgi:hypothetical protein
MTAASTVGLFVISMLHVTFQVVRERTGRYFHAMRTVATSQCLRRDDLDFVVFCFGEPEDAHVRRTLRRRAA